MDLCVDCFANFLFFTTLPPSLLVACVTGWTDADRAQKHGMDEFISANPCSFDHASLFEMVQRLTLDHRLNDNFACLVSEAEVEKGPNMWVHCQELFLLAIRVWEFREQNWLFG